MAGDSCDQKSVHVKKVNNVRHDGQTYETALNTVTRKNGGSVLDLQVGHKVIVNTAKKVVQRLRVETGLKLLWSPLALT